MDPIGTSYTRAQLAAAVDEAHAAIHEWIEVDGAPLPAEVEAIERAHDALHSVGAGPPRVGCATPDPEAQAIYADLRTMRDRPLPCGHKIEDIIGGADPKTGKPEVTKCGQCLADRQAEREAAPRTPETALPEMLRAYEAAAFDACKAYFRTIDPREETEQHARSRLLHRQCEIIRREAAAVAAGHPDPVDFETPGEVPGDSDMLMVDYEARLAGKRPLNAPPLEV